MGDDQKNLNVVLEYILGPMVAILFWLTILVVAMLAIARGELFKANIFEVFGAVGQVGFAGAVFWLGYQQFKFTKNVATRQEKIAAHDMRSKLYEEFKSNSNSFNYFNTTSDEQIEKLWSLSDKIERLFSDDAGAAASYFIEGLVDYATKCNKMANDRRSGALQSQLDEIAEDLERSRGDLQTRFDDALFEMHADIDLNV